MSKNEITINLIKDFRLTTNKRIKDKLSNRIFENNKKLVYNIVYKFDGGKLNLQTKEEIIQVGHLALNEAMNKFDISKNVNFSTFAYKYINGKICNFFRSESKYNNMLINLKADFKIKNLGFNNELIAKSNLQEINDIMNKKFGVVWADFKVATEMFDYNELSGKGVSRYQKRVIMDFIDSDNELKECIGEYIKNKYE